MGRKSSQGDQGAGAAPQFETVGMTILPGHPLPEWAADQPSGSEGAVPAELQEAVGALAAAGVPEAPTPGLPTVPAQKPGESVHAQPEFAHALVGAGVAAMAGAGHPPQSAGFGDAGPAGMGYPGAGYGPAAGTVGMGTPTGAGLSASGYATPTVPPTTGAGFPGSGSPSGFASPFAPPAPQAPQPFGPPAPRAPEAHAGGAASAPMSAAPAGMTSAHAVAPAPPSTGVPTATTGQMATAPQPWSASLGAEPRQPAQNASAPRSGWSTSDGPGAGTATLEAPAGAKAPTTSGSAPAPGAHTEAPAAPTPSAGWASPDRPELSPEHVALLTWWADMIAKGQFPAPPAAPSTPPTPPTTQTARRRRGRGKRSTDAPTASVKAAPVPAAGPSRRTSLVALGLGGVAVVGLAVAFGPTLVSSFTEEPAPVPASNLTMPSAVGDLVAVSTPDVSEQLQPLLGLGLRPAGITTTAGYAADPASPVVLAALASTTPADADATGQINQWAARMGATVGEPVSGSSGTGGVTCAAVSEIPNALPGSFCVWTGSDRRGQTYVVGASPEDALEQTAQLREGVTAAP